MNILIILEDALRPDHLGCYGYRKPTSPWIDRIAGEGVIFRNCFSTASHTLPPIVSLIMSQWPCTHGVVDPASFEQWIHSPAWETKDTPLKKLRKKGYAIDGELVARWKPLGFDKDTDSTGIPHYFGANRDGRWFFMAEPYPTHLPYNPPDEYYRQFLDERYTASKETFERLKVVRSCLIVHPTGMVSKLEAGEKDPLPDDQIDSAHKRTAGAVDLKPEDKPAVLACYDGELKVFDNLAGEWFSALEKSGALDDTLVIITSDHGEELMERGHVGHSSCNLMGTLYDESIRVPLIMRYPKVLPKGKVLDDLISMVDVFPTIFDLLGEPAPDSMEGESLLPLLSGGGGFARNIVFAETTPAGWQALGTDTRCIYCARTSHWKLILNTDRIQSFRIYELYDLQADPGERNNIYRGNHPAAVKLAAELNGYLKKKELIRWDD
ncbi:MAG: DUF4976 domain-containing protein [Spirochaetales bacterium]|nr:MAG: DUF4976 domain-containing protein [Spirochaetales bacterium]